MSESEKASETKAEPKKGARSRIEVNLSGIGDLGSRILGKLDGQLRALNVQIDDLDLEDLFKVEDDSGRRVKVVCVEPDLKESVAEMARSQRGQVVMVRVDQETSSKLDAWVETGAVKSRSEAAALFIREGLKVRDGELDRLEEALGEVETAKQRLRERAKSVFGGDDPATD